MSGAFPDQRTCLRCGELFAWDRDTCPECGAYQAVPPQLNVWGLAFMQNRLRRLVMDGEIAEPIAARLNHLLRHEQLAALGKIRPIASAPPPSSASPGRATIGEAREMTEPPAEAMAPMPATAAAAPPSAPATPGAFATSLAGPNLVLYLGAFLVVVSGLILVGITPEDLSAQLKVLLGIGGTLGFLAAGLLLHANETVRPAARTFLVLGAVLVPLDVWSIGTVALDAHHPARQHLLLTGSVLSAALYAVLAQRGYGVHFVYLMAVALAGAAEGLAQTLALEPSWRGVPHLGLAAALIVAARSPRTALAPLSGAPEGIVASIEVYAGTLIAWLVVVRIVGQQAIDVPNLLAATAFASVARTRIATERAELWSWVACAAGALGAYGLVPRQAVAIARVAALLSIAAVLWIAPVRVTALRWALTPGRVAGWSAAAGALVVGFVSGPDARALALAGVTAHLAFIAWMTERRDTRPGAEIHPVLLGALVGTYALWVSLLQVAAVLPADLGLRAPSTLAWATFAACAAAWTAAALLARTGAPWATDLRAAAHALAALCVVLMLSIGVPRPPRPDGVAVGASLGALTAGLALVYGIGVRQRRLPESAGLVIALGTTAILGGIETIVGRASPWATIAAAIAGAVAMASVAFARARAASIRAGAVAALIVALAAQLIYVRVIPELTFALLVVLGALLVCHLVPLVERDLRWTFSAAITVFSFIVARAATNALALDPHLATLPFVAILAAPSAAFAAMRQRSPEAERLLTAGAIALAMACALSLGRYGPAWSPAAAAVVIGSLVILALQRRDPAIAGSAVALAILAVETTIRHAGIRDILYQGWLYGLVVLAAGRLLASRGLLGDASVTRAVYATAVALLTLPAIVRAGQPGGWVAVAYLALGAAATITAAVRLRQHGLGIVGSVLGLMSLVTGIYQTHAAETLLYTTAAGAYLIGLGLYLGRVRSLATIVTRDLIALIRWGGPLLLLIPAVVRSWEGATYGVIFFVLFGLVLGGGLLLRQRSMLGSAAAALGLETVWVVTTVARLLPFWMLFGLAGLTLLGVGTVLVFRRDILERAQARFRAQWEVAE